MASRLDGFVSFPAEGRFGGLDDMIGYEVAPGLRSSFAPSVTPRILDRSSGVFVHQRLGVNFRS